MRRELSTSWPSGESAFALDDAGFQLIVVGELDVHEVACKAEFQRHAGGKLSRLVSLGVFTVVFGGVDRISHFDANESFSAEGSLRAGEGDFGLCLKPVFVGMAVDSTALLPEFLGATADGFYQFRRALFLRRGWNGVRSGGHACTS
jgi:hypothetical protein